MNLLLDTHALIWFAEGSAELSDLARQALESDANSCYFSVVSIWEMAIKIGLGKLVSARPLEPDFRRLLERNGLEQVGVDYQHAAAVAALPQHHRDPFDRLLIVQALLEDLTLVSQDAVISDYGVRRLW